MISVIIPAYNSSAYLDRCLASIFKQQAKDYEVIVVDDGSTDDTPAVCEKYKKEHSNLKVIRKINEGVSTARNTGLKNAEGDYIVFIDADDYLSENALETIEKNLRDDKDLYIYNNLIILKDGIHECPNSDNFDSIEDLIIEVVESQQKNHNEWLRTIWAKVYRKTILDEVKFPTEVHIGQDACFMVDLLNYLDSLERIAFFDSAWYVYDRTNELSATHKYKRDMFLLSRLQFDYFMKTVSTRKFTDEKKKNTALCKFCWKIFWILYFQGQVVKDNDNCFKWYEYTEKYITENCINEIDFDNSIMNRTFRYRKLLSNKTARSIIRKAYLYRNRNK